ncbi:hypothetical protein [Kluyvera intermedia]|jgi:hypothetical protein|uniref:hypothetical protein n=1 Tax=Kluyvera intermedia TaxID=61648 RepID=UPI002432F383|nr:hypothetical protein [Kluyvera intermedia]WEJ85632.1 MAG: hypothetical protein P0Y47_06115 [Kluyvera intermedia]
MNDFLEKFIDIENDINKETRFFIQSVQRKGITWAKYESQEMILNGYYYRVRNLLSEYDPDLIVLLYSDDAEIRRISLKVIKDGLVDLSSSNMAIEKLIYISIVGNEEEKRLAKDIIVFREWFVRCEQLTEKIVSKLYHQNIDYYLYKDIGEFLLITKNIPLLISHIKIGMNSKDEEIFELASEYSNIV